MSHLPVRRVAGAVTAATGLIRLRRPPIAQSARLSCNAATRPSKRISRYATRNGIHVPSFAPWMTRAAIRALEKRGLAVPAVLDHGESLRKESS